MPLSEQELEALLLVSAGRPRLTQDSPIYADVWLAYLSQPADHREDLLLEPHYRAPVGVLARAVQDQLGEVRREQRLAWAAEHVAVRLTLRELLRDVLPLSSWWQSLIRPQEGLVFAHLRAFARGDLLAPDTEGEPQEVPPPEDELQWWVRVAGRLLTDTSDQEAQSQGLSDLRVLTRRLLDELDDPEDRPRETHPLWSVNRNRPVRATLWRSRQTVKADAARRLFPADLEGLAWGVVDSGIDARHPAFRTRDTGGRVADELRAEFQDQSIVRATYDFTRLRECIVQTLTGTAASPAVAQAVEDALKGGVAVDWALYGPLIRIEHDEHYEPPSDAHGTHVAGTIAGDWRPEDEGHPRHPLQGVCPGLALYDLRVLDENGEGDEFSVLAALSFVRWRNNQSGGIVIHGVNLSFALDHDVRNSACGRSPVCLECARVHSSGVVVVAAAGNDGRADFSHRGSPPREGYRTVSITDPGNAQAAITVGSTHRLEPHAYGISYFSSRGPTGDGRAKPDLVAPGEKITGPVPGEKAARMDGTSMAAPHVSGAAALLMARYRELVGDPDRIKRVLCSSTTDLGRERDYQGHGMLDILRALQSV